MDTKNGVRGALKKNWWVIGAFLHLCFSLLNQRKIIDFGTVSAEDIWTVPINDGISLNAERFITYVISFTFGVIIIGLLWFLFSCLFSKKIPLHIKITVAVVFILTQSLMLFYWPEPFFGVDQFATYYFSTKLIPWYWKSAFTTVAYVASFVVFPHPISLSILQCVFFCSVIGYFMLKAEESLGMKPVWSYAFALLFLAPETYIIMSHPHRCDMYTILCIFFAGSVAFAAIAKEQLSSLKMAGLCLLGALVAVWRTEGLFLGLFGIAILLFSLKKEKKRLIIFTVCFLLVFFGFRKYQGIGEEKYYGRGYLVVSTITPVKNILNSAYANLYYDGALNDVSAIEEYMDIDELLKNGTAGWRSENYRNGYEDFNQSGKSKALEDGYISAALSLMLHNPHIYLGTQLNYLFDALNVDFQIPFAGYDGANDGIQGFEYTVCEKGINAYWDSYKSLEWENSEFRINIQANIRNMTESYQKFFSGAFGPALKIIIVLGMIVIFFAELGRVFKKKYSCTAIGILVMAVLMMNGIIFLTMPVGVDFYLYEVMYTSFVLEILYVFVRRRERKHIGE